MTGRRKERWLIILIGVAFSLLLFLVPVIIEPAVTGETISPRMVWYWAVAAPIAGTIVALIIRTIGRRWVGWLQTRLISAKRVILMNIAFAAPAALGITLIWIIDPWEITPADLVWWRVAGWVGIFLGLTVALGFFGALPQLLAQRVKKKREFHDDKADHGR